MVIETASVLGGIAKGLIGLITKVQFWIALFILFAVIVISGQIAALGTIAAGAPELAGSIMSYTLTAASLFILAVLFIAIVKYVR
jgi:hypothetical protein